MRICERPGKPEGHFLRQLKAIGKKAGVKDAGLHRFRKTYADIARGRRLGEHDSNPTRSRIAGCDPRISQRQGCRVARTCEQQQPGSLCIISRNDRRERIWPTSAMSRHGQMRPQGTRGSRREPEGIRHTLLCGGVQMVRTPACHAGGRGSESRVAADKAASVGGESLPPSVA